jgi:hypothetical protein
MEATMRILSVLENTKFSAAADISILQAAISLLFNDNKDVLSKGSKTRERLLEIISGKLVLDTAAYASLKELDSLVQFLQGLLIFALSLVNGIGRSPISISAGGEDKIKIKIQNKPQSFNITIGKYDAEMGKLVREFKTYFFGKASDETLGRTDLLIIKEALQETRRRLKNEKLFIDKLARDPKQIFAQKNADSQFGGMLFLVLSALPPEQLNNLLLNIGSYLPAELQETNEDMFKVGVRSYLTTATQDMHELFKKVRLLVKLYFGKQREIISIIVKEKTKQLFADILKNEMVHAQVVEHLKGAADDQFALRMKLIDNILKVI